MLRLLLTFAVQTIFLFSVCRGREMLVRDLEEELLTNYSTNVIPEKTESERIKIYASFHLIYIVSFDEREEFLTSSTWLSFTWRDVGLSWEGKPRYENVTSIYLQQKQIWKPDFILLNSIEDLKLLGTSYLGVTVKKDGTVLWEPGQTFKSICEVNIHMYPFDSQECQFWFGSWTYLNDIEGVLSYPKIGMDAFQENGKWMITGSTAKSGIVPYAYYTQPTLTFTVFLRRRRTYYIMTICIPLVILSIVNCLVHVLPADSGEKMSFCTTVLLSYLVFISFLNDSLPSTSKTVSLLAVYLIFVIGLSFLSVVNSVLVLYFWHRPATKSNESSARSKNPSKLSGEYLEDQREDENDRKYSRSYAVLTHHDSTYGSEMKSDGNIRILPGTNGIIRDLPTDVKNLDERFQQYARLLDRVLFVVSVLTTITVTVTLSTIMLLG